MTTKYIPSLLILVLGLSMSVFAQQGQGRAQGGKGMGMAALPVQQRVTTIVTNMDTRLLLSDDQKEKLTTLYTAHFEAMDAIRAEGTRPTQQERQTYQTGMITSVKDVLTEEQVKLFDTYKSEFMPGPRMGQGRGANRTNNRRN